MSWHVHIYYNMKLSIIVPTGLVSMDTLGDMWAYYNMKLSFIILTGLVSMDTLGDMWAYYNM